jgi:hypothetical protein
VKSTIFQFLLKFIIKNLLIKDWILSRSRKYYFFRVTNFPSLLNEENIDDNKLKHKEYIIGDL